MNQPNRLYVGNLPWDTTDDLLADLFNLGERAAPAIKMVTDRDTGEFRGFAFITMANERLARVAISLFDGYTVGSRALRVRVAEDKR